MLFFQFKSGFWSRKTEGTSSLASNKISSWPKDVTVCVPAKGPLPMGSFCGADGYGLIHPFTINAAVIQCCIASSTESRSHYKFGAMALTPNLDLMMSCKDAERVAQTIVHWNGGAPRTDKLERIKPPGADGPLGNAGSDDWKKYVQKEASLVFSQPVFREWTGTYQKYSTTGRRIDRERIGEGLRAAEASLFSHMSILVTQVGANLRAYHFLRNQETLGFRKSEKITILEVKEVVDQILEWKWVSPCKVNEENHKKSANHLNVRPYLAS